MPSTSINHCLEFNQLVKYYTFPFYYVLWNPKSKTWKFLQTKRKYILPYKLTILANIFALVVCLVEIILFLRVGLLSNSKVLVLGFLIYGILIHLLITFMISRYGKNGLLSQTGSSSKNNFQMNSSKFYQNKSKLIQTQMVWENY